MIPPPEPVEPVVPGSELPAVLVRAEPYGGLAGLLSGLSMVLGAPPLELQVLA